MILDVKLSKLIHPLFLTNSKYEIFIDGSSQNILNIGMTRGTKRKKKNTWRNGVGGVDNTSTQLIGGETKFPIH